MVRAAKSKAASRASGRVVKSAAIDADLERRLAEEADKHHRAQMDSVTRSALQMTELWAPHTIDILKQLRKTGVDVQSLRNLLEEGALDRQSKAGERLAEKINEQREKILAAIAAVADIADLERQIRAQASAEPGDVTIDGVLALRGRKEG